MNSVFMLHFNGHVAHVRVYGEPHQADEARSKVEDLFVPLREEQGDKDW